MGRRHNMSEQNKKTSTGLQENIEGLLCYLGAFVTGIIFLVIEKENKFVRFHAVQSIAISVVIFVIQVILGITIIGLFLLPIVGIVAFILWIFLMYKAYQGKMYKLPIIGDFAEKQVGK
jgi:uncharacterized membrane protein